MKHLILLCYLCFFCLFAEWVSSSASSYSALDFTNYFFGLLMMASSVILFDSADRLTSADSAKSETETERFEVLSSHRVGSNLKRFPI